MNKLQASLRLITLLLISRNSVALSWQDLWATPQQQGQEAYRKQDYQQAAEKFSDPQWKAAAEYRAGNYDQAIQALQGVENSDAFYNTGNAYAQQGKLPEALQAYEQALQLNPDNEDAQHNRDIVQEALQKQQQQNQDSQSGEQQNAEQQSGQDKQQQQDAGQSGDQQQQADASEPSPQDGQQQGAQQASANESQDEPINPQNQRQQSQEEEAEQQQNAMQPKAGEEADEQQQATAAQSADPVEHDEAQQASEQWLNRIPDDPAGLLRRKFAYQYQQRKREQGLQRDAW